MQLATKQGRSEDRARRKDDSRMLKRKKRTHVPYLSQDDLAGVFRPFSGAHAPTKLLSSPSAFLRQMQRTFDAEFPGFMSGPELLAAVTANATPACQS